VIADDDASAPLDLTATVDGVDYTITTGFNMQELFSLLEKDTIMLGVDFLVQTFAYPVVVWALLAQLIPFFYGLGRRWALFGIFFMNWFGALWFDLILAVGFSIVADQFNDEHEDISVNTRKFAGLAYTLPVMKTALFMKLAGLFGNIVIAILF